jgi:hypothetical protein
MYGLVVLHVMCVMWVVDGWFGATTNDQLQQPFLSELVQGIKRC